jgi:hypothetical protein
MMRYDTLVKERVVLLNKLNRASLTEYRGFRAEMDYNNVLMRAALMRTHHITEKEAEKYMENKDMGTIFPDTGAGWNN